MSGNAFGNIFGGVLGYAFGLSHSPLAKWKLFPLVFGGISFAFGFLFLFVVPNTVQEARFFNEAEKRIASESEASSFSKASLTPVLRIRANMTGTHTDKHKLSEVKEAFLDPKTYLFGAMSFFNNLQASGPGTFGSQIVASFGFSTLDTTVLQSIPTGGFQAICVLLFGYIATHSKDKRSATFSNPQ